LIYEPPPPPPLVTMMSPYGFFVEHEYLTLVSPPDINPGAGGINLYYFYFLTIHILGFCLGGSCLCWDVDCEISCLMRIYRDSTFRLPVFKACTIFVGGIKCGTCEELAVYEPANPKVLRYLFSLINLSSSWESRDILRWWAQPSRASSSSMSSRVG